MHCESFGGTKLVARKVADAVGDLGVLERDRGQQELDDEVELEEVGALLDKGSVKEHNQDDLSDHDSDAN